MTISALPSHVAIIMDGNGRWAELRRRDRTIGHLKGARVAKQTIEHCADLGVKQLTLYAFSTENWMRPAQEVSFLMRLLARHLRKERRNLVKNNIRFSVIGETHRLPNVVLAEVTKTIEETRQCSGMSLTFALSYGSRQELTTAMQSLAKDASEGRIQPDQITEQMIEARLQTAFMGNLANPDLIIRTSGEYRLSNFLLWQAAYSELYITSTLWPDFSAEELSKAFKQFSCRERRFGRTGQQIKEISSTDLVEDALPRHASI